MITQKAYFANRPQSPSLMMLTEGGRDIALANYTPTWKLHTTIAKKALRQYMSGNHLENVLHKTMTKCLKLMAEEPGPTFDPEKYLDLMVFNVCSEKASDQDDGLCNPFQTEKACENQEQNTDSNEDCSAAKKEKRKLDNLGRVRPCKYTRRKEVTRKKSNEKNNVSALQDCQENNLELSNQTSHERTTHQLDKRYLPEQIDYINQTESLHTGITENKTEDFFKSSKDLCEIVNEIVENNTHTGVLDEDSFDNLISDEKWSDLIQVNHEEQDENDDQATGENVQAQFDETNESLENNAPIYPGHPMTIHNSMLLILLYTICHSISGAQLSDMLTLISLHCLQSHPGLESIYMFKKYFAKMHSPLQKHFYCRYCMSNVEEGEETCPSKDCGKNISGIKNKQYFIEIPLEQQIEKIMKRPDILSTIKGRFSRRKKRKDGIEDIYDGTIYKKLSDDGGPLSEENPSNISFTWNTDGIPVFKSSKFSLWPFYLVINELPYRQRMMKENMILCGLWFGESKPFMSLFTKPLMKSLRNLETNGIEYEIEGTKIFTKAFLICGTADLPAKSLVQNCNQFNGQFSCMRCLHPGETYKTQAGGCVHVFPYDASKPNYTERTLESCVHDAFKAIESKKTNNGIKGPSFLMTLKSYDYVKSTSIDYMHGVLLGIGKLLTKLWVSGSYSKEKFSISKYVDIIDERLLQIKPPSIITRVPRSLSEHFKYWKASELRSWLLFIHYPYFVIFFPKSI